VEAGFLDAGRGVGKMNKSKDSGSSPSGDASATKEVVSPFMVDKNVEMENQIPLADTTGVGSYPPLPTSGYARVMIELRADVELKDNIFVAMPKIFREGHYTCGTGGKKTVKKPSQTSRGVPFNSMNGLDAMLENGPWFIQNNLLILKKWHPDENLLNEDMLRLVFWMRGGGVGKMNKSKDSGSSPFGDASATKEVISPIMVDKNVEMENQIPLADTTGVGSYPPLPTSGYARVMIELRADVELKDNIFVAMPKISREGHYTCGAGGKKTVKKPSQTSRGVPVGPKIGKRLNSPLSRKGDEERSEKTDVTTGDDFKKLTKIETKMPVKEAENEPNRKGKKEKTTKAYSSQPVEYYLKHGTNEKLIEGLVGNHRFNDSLPRARVRKITGKTYNLSPRGPVYEAILRKKIIRKVDIRENFEIPCNIGGLKHINALVDQGSDVNFMPLSTHMKLTDERPVETDIRLSLASHSYIYPLGIADDVFVEVVDHVYPVGFVILYIKEDENRPFILGTPFLTIAKAVNKFYKGTITLRSGKSKISFHRIPESLCFYAVLSSDLTNKIACRKFLIKNEEEIFTDARDGVRICADSVASPAM
nr:hypothetical protein [Tanacetum cinerariifolium]